MNFPKEVLREYIKQKRIKMAKKYVEDSSDKSLLDIGCDDKFFIKKFNKLQTTGIDKNLGHHVEKKINFKDNSFDYVSILAVIEHLNYPEEIIKECARVLKKNGLLIITVPRNNFIFDFLHDMLYSKEEQEEEGLHIQDFNKTNMTNISCAYFNLKIYKLFEVGLNQLFVFENKY